MGRKFGKVINGMRHVVQYKVSPYEQRAFAGFFADGAPNLVRRFFDQVFFVLPGGLAFTGVYYWMEKKYHHVCRKDPRDFEGEE